MSRSNPPAAALAGIAKWWWLMVVTGVLWLVVAFVLFQYDTRSVATLGYIVGFMLLFNGLELFVLATAVSGWRWLWYLFGALLVAGGVWAIFNPGATVAALAFRLGFLLALVAVTWLVEAIVTRRDNPLWGLGLLSAVILGGIAFWVGQQGYLEKAITLLAFAGVWAIVQGVGDIVRGIQLKRIGALVNA